MTKEFEETIKKLKEQNNLFYNSSGNKFAYKLFVRHISFAEKLDYGRIDNGILYLKRPLMLVDFEKEKIFLKRDQIKVIPLC